MRDLWTGIIAALIALVVFVLVQFAYYELEFEIQTREDAAWDAGYEQGEYDTKQTCGKILQELAKKCRISY